MQYKGTRYCRLRETIPFSLVNYEFILLEGLDRISTTQRNLPSPRNLADPAVYAVHHSPSCMRILHTPTGSALSTFVRASPMPHGWLPVSQQRHMMTIRITNRVILIVVYWLFHNPRFGLPGFIPAQPSTHVVRGLYVPEAQPHSDRLIFLRSSRFTSPGVRCNFMQGAGFFKRGCMWSFRSSVQTASSLPRLCLISNLTSI